MERETDLWRGDVASGGRVHDDAASGLVEARVQSTRVKQRDCELFERAHVVREPERFEQGVVAEEAVGWVCGAAQDRELAQLR